MLIYNNVYIPNKVLSNRGMLDIMDINSGDFLYEYKTSNPKKVIYIERSNIVPVYKLTYTDGREQLFGEDELYFNGEDIISIDKNINIDIFNPIESNPVFYMDGKSLLIPDPYTAGMLFISGDPNDKYLNITYKNSYKLSVVKHICNKYNLYSYKVKNKIYFTKTLLNLSRNNTKRVTYKDFFNDENFNSDLILDEYMFASYANRFQFIRGVLDISFGMNMMNSSNNIKIVNQSEIKLLELQKLLWSLGVNSTVKYDPYVDIDDNTIESYCLDIIDLYKKYPGFFHQYDAIESMIDINNSILYDTSFDIKVNKITHVGTGYSYNVKLEDDKVAYLTSSFLPKISL